MKHALLAPASVVAPARIVAPASCRLSRERLRITAQLIQTRDQMHVWARLLNELAAAGLIEVRPH